MFTFDVIFVVVLAKKNPQRDLAHLRYIDSMPLIEGEKPSLVRAGSDGFLNEHTEPESDFMEVRTFVGLTKTGQTSLTSREVVINYFHGVSL